MDTHLTHRTERHTQTIRSSDSASQSKHNHAYQPPAGHTTRGSDPHSKATSLSSAGTTPCRTKSGTDPPHSTEQQSDDFEQHNIDVLPLSTENATRKAVSASVDAAATLTRSRRLES